MIEDGFMSFLCPSCSTEIEATLDMIGERTLCPACGADIVVPDNRTPDEAAKSGGDGIVRHGQSEGGTAKTKAQKGRTIRIELGDF